MDAIMKKKELINWLQSLDDLNILLQIEKIKDKDTEKFYTIDEARKLSLSKIEKWSKK
ncbi:MAG: hypothetical protein WDZ45_01670 [Flavobacteriaceae bacterium]